MFLSVLKMKSGRQLMEKCNDRSLCINEWRRFVIALGHFGEVTG